MKWYNFIACFLLGVFVVNSIPHFLHGISGDHFPTPFANPPGKGLSSPQVNVIWAFVNMAMALFMVKFSRISWTNKWSIGIFVLGFVVMSIRLSFALANKA